MKNSGFTLRKRALSFKYAFHGIFLLISREHNAWIHCFAAVCVITAGILVGLSSMEWIVICLCIGLVLSAEAVNSAIEALADRVYLQRMMKPSNAPRDLAAGAVLLLAIASAVVGLIIFLPKLTLLL